MIFDFENAAGVKLLITAGVATAKPVDRDIAHHPKAPQGRHYHNPAPVGLWSGYGLLSVSRATLAYGYL